MCFLLNSAAKQTYVLFALFTYVEIKSPIMRKRVSRLFSYHLIQESLEKQTKTKKRKKKKNRKRSTLKKEKKSKDGLVLFRVIRINFKGVVYFFQSYFLLGLSVIEVGIKISNYNCGFVTSLRYCISFCFTYFEVLMVGT